MSNVLSSDGWIDVTVPIREGMVSWPGDPGFERTLRADMRKGDVCNLSHLSLGAHTGTHMDAPLHFVADGEPMGSLPLDAVMGEARIIAIESAAAITPDELARHDIQPDERIIFKTRNSHAPWWNEPFKEDFVAIRADAGQYLVERGVRTVGVDYLSIGAYQRDGAKTHQIMLGAGIWVIEGLDLTQVKPGKVELICLPLKMIDAEGCPARALLRPID